MSDHQNGGGLPVVGILAVLIVLPLAGWVLFASSAAPPAVLTTPVHTPATAPISREAGSSVVPEEELPLEEIDASAGEAAEEAPAESSEAPTESTSPEASTETNGE